MCLYGILKIMLKMQKLNQKRRIVIFLLNFFFIYFLILNINFMSKVISKWKAHIHAVNALEYVENSRIVITCSNDFSIRLWSLKNGFYIGTFGQDEIWNIHDIKTYKHPLVPYDLIITDPLKLDIDLDAANDLLDASKMTINQIVIKLFSIVIYSDLKILIQMQINLFFVFFLKVK
jgi:hypothetical protein